MANILNATGSPGWPFHRSRDDASLPELPQAPSADPSLPPSSPVNPSLEHPRPTKDGIPPSVEHRYDFMTVVLRSAWRAGARKKEESNFGSICLSPDADTLLSRLNRESCALQCYPILSDAGPPTSQHLFARKAPSGSCGLRSVVILCLTPMQATTVQQIRGR